MSMYKYSFFFLIAYLICCVGCKELYFPPVESLQNQLLVVEANLAYIGPTTIRLTRTTKLNNNSIQPENSATVSVEGKDNTIRFLSSAGNGNYSSSNLNLILNNEYRLRIKTSSGKEYLSGYVKAMSNPPLDSISWERKNDGVQIYVNTNDPTNTIKYFRWDYFETWEIRSTLQSNIIFQNNRIRNRNFPAEDVSVCWKNSPSTRILLASSDQLQSGIISKMPVLFIPLSDEKLFIRYSIIARQYALDKDGHKYFEILKKNTEEIGSFFGPLPAEVKGNLYSVSDQNEPVIGYVTGSGVSEKRIFINFSQVAPWPNLNFCEAYSIPPDSVKYYSENGGLLLASYLGNPPDRYLFGTPYCVDCTSRGGANVKPSFW